MNDTAMMDLKTFIRDTLVQIVEGVQEASSAISQSQSNAVVNPTHQDALHGEPSSVAFDVAVTVSSKTTGKGEAGLKVVGLSLGGGAERGHSTASVSHIHFSVPVAMPSVAKQKNKPMYRTDNRAYSDSTGY